MENIKLGKPPELTAHAVQHNGGMSIEIDGEIQPFTSFKITETPDTESMLEAARVEIPGMARQDVTLCWVPIFVDWTGPGEYDFSDMDRRIQTILDLYDKHAIPNSTPARIVVRIQAAVFTPIWYVKQSENADGMPTNLIEYRNPWGATVDACSTEKLKKQRYATAFADYGSTLGISLGDTFWDTDAVDCLKAIIEHVRSSDYAHRVFGWLPCALNTNEWFLRTFAPEASCDFSAPTQQAFKEHLHSKGISCDDAPVPLPRYCLNSDKGEFLDPSNSNSRLVEEFSQWSSNRIVDIIQNFAETLKTAYIDSPKLIGFFYGYSLGLSRLQDLSQCGQLAVNRVLENDNIDFICSPNEYFFRADEKPFTASTVMGPFADSGACCNKLVFLEDDHRPGSNLAANSAWSTRDKWHDEMFFKHIFAQMLSHGQQLWWYSLGAQWFKDQYRQEIAGNLHRIGLEALQKDRSSVAEVAVVIDERTISTMRFNPKLQQTLLTESHGVFFQSGTPFETFELQSFLHKADHSRFKVVVFLNLFRVDDSILSAVNKLKTDNKTLMFSFAPGFVDDSGETRTFSSDSATKLTGMCLKEANSNVPLSVWVDPERVSLFSDGKDRRYAWQNMDIGVNPTILQIEDKDAESLGFLHSGAIGFARKKHQNWNSVFSVMPCLPAEILRAVLKQAGVHLYTENGDVIYTNKSMLTIVASSSGEKVITLQSYVKLVDAQDKTVFEPDDKNRISLNMKRHETRIFWKCL